MKKGTMEMKYYLWLLIMIIIAIGISFPPNDLWAQKALDARLGPEGKAGQVLAAKAGEPTGPTAMPVTIQVDKTILNNGGTITVSGHAAPGQPVYLEIWSEKKVRASRFDADVDKNTGKRPYVLCMTDEMPAYYQIYVPQDQKGILDRVKKEGPGWSLTKVLKDLGAEAVCSVPLQAKIDQYQASLMGSIIGSRGELLPIMDKKENARRSMQLLKARARKPEKLIVSAIEMAPDGAYHAQVKIPDGLVPGRYSIVAIAGGDPSRSQPVHIENQIHFPNIYLANAGTSLNLIGPFFLSLGIAIFGVLMGAGGGFMLNPLLVSLWPLPHTIVAGTVMPTVLFSQGTGIYNYSKIKFINWKLGSAIGLAMVAGGFLGPKLTELITLDQFKFVFGWILIILASLMFWQTTPRYLSKNKKEQAILKEFKKKAEETMKKK